MSPTSPTLLVLLILASAGAVLFVVRVRIWWLQATAGFVVVLLGMGLGMAAVNDHFGYYRSWSALVSDIGGGPGPSGMNVATVRVGNEIVKAGIIKSVSLPGPRSHLNRNGYIYLPPEYTNPRYAHVRFPVVELLHGSPGGPSDWVRRLDLLQTAATLIARHLTGPLVIVMPRTNSGTSFQECLNSRLGADETYLTVDVPSDVRKQYRVSDDPAQWGLGGYSSGGYCAANLALRHPTQFGAAASMDGYYRAKDGPAADALGPDRVAQAENSPLTIVQNMPADTRPLPNLWIFTGTKDKTDFAAASAFVTAMRGLEQVTFVTQSGARHDYYSWAAALPSLLAWMWTQLAPPALRVAFPIRGSATSVYIPPHIPPVAPPVKPTGGEPVRVPKFGLTPRTPTGTATSDVANPTPARSPRGDVPSTADPTRPPASSPSGTDVRRNRRGLLAAQ